MTTTQAIILGLIQGLTEYIPVSSSAHLVLIPKILGWQFSPAEAFIFDVLVQLGTLLGVLIYFAADIKHVIISVLKGLIAKKLFYNDDAKLGWMVVLATVPAAVIGLAFKDDIAAYFSSPIASCYFLILTAFLLLMADRFKLGHKTYPSAANALYIGFAQALALFPGLSRSGATISAGMTAGLSRQYAARFSFLMSIPVMLGAGLIASIDLLKNPNLLDGMLEPLIYGFFTALISGYLVIKWFMAYIGQHRLLGFAAYCLIVGLAGAIWF